MSTDFYILLVLFCLALVYCIEEHRWYRMRFDELSEDIVYLERCIVWNLSEKNKIDKGDMKDDIE